MAARSDGGSWKSRFKACRRRLSEAVEETKEARRTARDVPSLQAEVARLETLLSEAGIASAFDTAGALRKENARLRKALAASKAREGATGPWPAPPRRRTVLEPSPDQKETVRSLRTELRRLDKEVVRRNKDTSTGFEPHSTGWEGSIWGISVNSPLTKSALDTSGLV